MRIKVKGGGNVRRLGKGSSPMKRETSAEASVEDERVSSASLSASNTTLFIREFNSSTSPNSHMILAA
jgi:hypothetical protein